MRSAQDFARLAAEGYNRIPLVREILSDLDTPLSVFLKLADAPGAFLLESVEGARLGAVTRLSGYRPSLVSPCMAWC